MSSDAIVALVVLGIIGIMVFIGIGVSLLVDFIRNPEKFIEENKNESKRNNNAG